MLSKYSPTPNTAKQSSPTSPIQLITQRNMIERKKNNHRSFTKFKTLAIVAILYQSNTGNCVDPLPSKDLYWYWCMV
jgi:hypothetical protein